MVIECTVKGISDVEIPYTFQCTEKTAVLYGDYNFDCLSRSGSFFLRENGSFYIGREPPCHTEGAGEECGEDNPHHKEGIASEDEKKKYVDNIYKQKRRQMQDGYMNFFGLFFGIHLVSTQSTY
ncbi:MAG: hypothetical protein K2L82_09200 [Lachnospiraceae bacterium]|nr:hypothetical protein [Lachnospiraceae bacterium]